MRDYADPQYTAWRSAIRRRDKNVCGLCNRYFKKGICHHIRRWADAPMLRYDVNNGIFLCRPCHKVVTGDEELYAGTFATKIVTRLTGKRYKDYFIEINKLMMETINEKNNNTEI